MKAATLIFAFLSLAALSLATQELFLTTTGSTSPSSPDRSQADKKRFINLPWESLRLTWDYSESFSGNSVINTHKLRFAPLYRPRCWSRSSSFCKIS